MFGDVISIVSLYYEKFVVEDQKNFVHCFEVFKAVIQDAPWNWQRFSIHYSPFNIIFMIYHLVIQIFHRGAWYNDNRCLHLLFQRFMELKLFVSYQKIQLLVSFDNEVETQGGSYIKCRDKCIMWYSILPWKQNK